MYYYKNNMPITSLKVGEPVNESLKNSQLPLIVHGALDADISIICYGHITEVVIEASQFINHAYPSISINVIQLNQLDPFPADQAKKILLAMKNLYLIESDVELDLYRTIYKHLGIKLNHHHYFNPSQPQLVADIIAAIKEEFFITK